MAVEIFQQSDKRTDRQTLLYLEYIRTAFFEYKMPSASRVQKAGINLMIVYFYIRRKLDIIQSRHNFPRLKMPTASRG